MIPTMIDSVTVWAIKQRSDADGLVLYFPAEINSCIIFALQEYDLAD